MIYVKHLCAVLLLLTTIQQSCQLECYVCRDQEDNKNKCVQTVKTCNLEQDQCLSEVRWGSPPSWSLAEQKHYFISKRCATKAECQTAIADPSHKCDRISYNDWNCTSCCGGDKCNHYVTLAGHSQRPNWLTLALSSGLSLVGVYIFGRLKATHICSAG